MKNSVKVKAARNNYRVFTGDIYKKNFSEIWETANKVGKMIDESRYNMEEVSRNIYASYDMYDGDVCTGMWAKLGQKWYECRPEET